MLSGLNVLRRITDALTQATGRSRTRDKHKPLAQIREVVEANSRIDATITRATAGKNQKQYGVYLEQLYRRAASKDPLPAVCGDCKHDWSPERMVERCPYCKSLDWWDYTDPETEKLFVAALKRAAAGGK